MGHEHGGITRANKFTLRRYLLGGITRVNNPQMWTTMICLTIPGRTMVRACLARGQHPGRVYTRTASREGERHICKHSHTRVHKELKHQNY